MLLLRPGRYSTVCGFARNLLIDLKMEYDTIHRYLWANLPTIVKSGAYYVAHVTVAALVVLPSPAT